MRAGGAVGETHADQRLGRDQFAELAELIYADIIGVNSAPILIGPGRAMVAITDAMFPAVAAGVHGGAAPAKDARSDFLDRLHDIRPPALLVVGGHQGKFVDPNAAFALGAQLEDGVIGLADAGHFDRAPAPFRGWRWKLR